MKKKLIFLMTIMMLINMPFCFAKNGPIYGDSSRVVITPYHYKQNSRLLNGVLRIELNKKLDIFTALIMFGDVISMKENGKEITNNSYCQNINYTFTCGEIDTKNYLVTRIKYTAKKPPVFTDSFLSTSQYAIIGIAKDKLLKSYGVPKSTHTIVDYELLHYEGYDNYMDAVIDIKTNTLKSVEIGMKNK